MNPVLKAVASHAKSRPDAIALQGDSISISYYSLNQEITNARQCMQRNDLRRIGLLMDNSPAWAVIDLAALSNNSMLVPLASFFSDQQLLHAIDSASLDTIITDDPGRLMKLMPHATLRPRARILGQNMWHISIPVSRNYQLPGNTTKITFTSGTTGTPKGVCLSADAINSVALSLADITTVEKGDRHLSLLPLPVLLENIAGLYVALLRGVPCVLPSSSALGSQGSRTIDFSRLFSAIKTHQATSIILLPEMLQALLTTVEQGLDLSNLRFIAVGGASVSPALLKKAESLDLPVYEGYGLSECASVVAVNAPEAVRRGSVGKPLPHVKVSTSTDNEILVSGPAYTGYLNETSRTGDKYLATGDLGYLDEDGYLYITGRKKNVFITSFGRNISPEWIEREIQAQPAIAQVAVFGESRPWNIALVVPSPGATIKEIDEAIKMVNLTLPDYARVSKWLTADEAFTPENGQYTINGRPRREAIWISYVDQINQLYEPIETKYQYEVTGDRQ